MLARDCVDSALAFNRRLAPVYPDYMPFHDFSPEARCSALDLMRDSWEGRWDGASAQALAVAYVDLYLSQTEGRLGEAELSRLCVAAAYLAAKVEAWPRPVNSSVSDQICAMEVCLAGALRFRFYVPTAMDFAAHYRVKMGLPCFELWTSFFVELALLDYPLLRFGPDVVGVTCVALAEYARTRIPATFEEVSRLAGADTKLVLTCARELSDFYCSAASSHFAAFRRTAAIYRRHFIFPGLVFGQAMFHGDPPSLRGLGNSVSGYVPRFAERSEPDSETPVYSEFRCLEEIFRGSNGVIYRASAYLADGQAAEGAFAVKKFDDSEQRGLRVSFILEAAVYAVARSPFLAQSLSAGVTQGLPYLAMELCEFDLWQLRKVWNVKAPRPGEMAKIFRQTLEGLAYLHSIGVIHGDVKAENVLIYNGEARLADFGLATWAGHPVWRSDVQSEPYRAPEHLLGSTEVRPSSDLWAYGCLVVVVASGSWPFEWKSGKKAHLTDIFRRLGTPTARSWPAYDELRASAGGCDLSDEAFAENKSYLAFADSPWRAMKIPKGEAAAKLYKQTLICNPDKRATAKELLA